MVRLRYLKQTSIRVLLYPLNNSNPLFNYSTISTTTTTTKAAAYNPFLPSFSPPFQRLKPEDLVVTFQNWFKSSGNPFLDSILQVLSSHGSLKGVNENEDLVMQREDLDVALSRLNLRLTESLVLDVLAYANDVLSCTKFFDWAGRQPGFHHTRATFNAIFKILSKAKLMTLMLAYLDNINKDRGGHKTNFHNILVMGYAVAGKPEISLQLFGRMRYQGIDLDDFTYHVLLNALVEEGYFDGVESVAKQIKNRGFESEITYSILVKGFCRKKEFDRAETYLRGVINTGVKIKSGGYIVGALVDGLCKNDEFDKAGKLVDEFGDFHVYDIWIRELVRARKLDKAMDFLQETRNQDLYFPDVIRYNTLILRLLRENRLEEVTDLVNEMKENNILPDELTMNIVLCFFCKVGMVDIALKLYESREEINLSSSSMAFIYIMNTLCEDGNVIDAYKILKNSLHQGYFPEKMPFLFSILADSLCKIGKFEMMNELFRLALEHDVELSEKVHEKYIKALCKSGELEDGYFIHEELSRLNKVTTFSAYNTMIHGFIKRKNGDIASRLLIEMQEKGHTPTRKLLRTVIQSVCEMENPEKDFQKLFRTQLSFQEIGCGVLNVFIHGAGLAKKPELAKKVYQIMKENGVSPNVSSDILVLQSYLKSEKISNALNFYYDIMTLRKIGRKVCNAMVIGLCKANKPDLAFNIFMEIREKEKSVRPSLECYEELIQVLCNFKLYEKVKDLVVDLIRVGRPVSSFIGNNLLLFSLKDSKLYASWLESTRLTQPSESTESTFIWRLGEVLGLFCDQSKDDLDNDELEEAIGTCFPLDIYTYNMIIRKLSKKRVDDAYRLFKKNCENGCNPNQWTYETMIHGFYSNGRVNEAKILLDEMERLGFEPSEATKALF